MVASMEAAIFNCQCDQMQNCEGGCETFFVIFVQFQNVTKYGHLKFCLNLIYSCYLSSLLSFTSSYPSSFIVLY